MSDTLTSLNQRIAAMNKKATRNTTSNERVEPILKMNAREFLKKFGMPMPELVQSNKTYDSLGNPQLCIKYATPFVKDFDKIAIAMNLESSIKPKDMIQRMAEKETNLMVVAYPDTPNGVARLTIEDETTTNQTVDLNNIDLND